FILNRLRSVSFKFHFARGQVSFAKCQTLSGSKSGFETRNYLATLVGPVCPGVKCAHDRPRPIANPGMPSVQEAAGVEARARESEVLAVSPGLSGSEQYPGPADR